MKVQANRPPDRASRITRPSFLIGVKKDERTDMEANNHVRVTKASEIVKAVELAERYCKRLPKQSGTQVCPLICEELLLRLLAAGCSEISVSSKGILSGYIEIKAAGDRVDPWNADTQNTDTEAAADRIGAQINGCLLEQYADHYTCQYKKGINLFRVSARKRTAFDLTGEIYAFYDAADPKKPHKPTDVLWYIARNHKAFFAVSVFILLLKHLAALMLPVFVSNIINAVTKTGSFFIRPVMVNLLLSAAAIIVNLVCFWLDSHCYRRFARVVEAGFRMALVQKLQVLSIRFHSSARSGAILSKLVSDVQFIQMLIYDRFMEILYLCEDVIFIIIIALTSFPLMLAFYLIIVPAAVFLLRRFSEPLKEKRAQMRRGNEQVSNAVKEMLEMESLTRSHGLEKTEYRSILSKVRGALQVSVSYDKQTVSVNNITYGGFQGLRLLSLSIVALLTAKGYIQIGTLVLFQSIFDLIINNVQRLLDALPLITQGYDSLVSINEILYEDDIEQNGTELLPAPVRGEIEFRHVSFSYEADAEPVLKDISFKVPAGGSIAFTGKSGEGKTTLLKLLLGLYRVQSGEILIDGKNLDGLEKAAYRSNIAVVPQNTVLFSGSLWDNLVFGLRYVSADQVNDVIKSVGLEDFVAELPDGLYTQIPENGSSLSGGQRQRISIARALLRSPRIIVLDEATSALDSVSERQVQEAIDAMMGRCTVVMSAHRLETLRHVDTVCRIDNGKLHRYENIDQLLLEMEGDNKA